MDPKHKNTKIKTSRKSNNLAQIALSEPAKSRERVKPSVDASTLDRSSPDALIEHAVAEAASINAMSENSKGRLERRTRELIRRMLLVGESFDKDGKFDNVAFEAFADDRLKKVRGKITNPWQRLAKLCVPKDTKASLVSKYGYVIAALRSENIRSDSVLAEFEKPLPIEEGGREYRGLERFVRLYKRDQGARSGEPEAIVRFGIWSRNRMIRNAVPFLEALYGHNLLLIDNDNVRELLADEAH